MQIENIDFFNFCNYGHKLYSLDNQLLFDYYSKVLFFKANQIDTAFSFDQPIYLEIISGQGCILIEDQEVIQYFSLPKFLVIYPTTYLKLFALSEQLSVKVYYHKHLNYSINTCDKPLSLTNLNLEINSLIISNHHFYPCYYPNNEFYELIIISEGTTNININNKQFTMEKGDYIFIKAKQAYHFNNNYNLRYYSFQFKLKGNQIPSIINQKYYKNLAPTIINDLITIYNCTNDKREFMLKNYVISLLIHTAAINNKLIVNNQDRKIISEAITYIHTNITSVSVESLLAFLNISNTNLNNLFKEHQLGTLAKYIVTIKMYYAKHLIIDTDYKLSKICLLLQLNLQNFNKTFINIHGYSPQTLRNRSLYYK